MSDQYTITVPVKSSDGKISTPRVGVMLPMLDSERVYVITLDFPVDATEFLAIAQGSGAIGADEHANTGPQIGPVVFPFPSRQCPSAEKTVDSTTDNNAEGRRHD